MAPPWRSRASRLAARYDHGGQRRPGGGLEGLLPPAVHLDQVEQRSDDAVDAGQQLGTGRAPGLVECTFERVRTRLGAGVLLLRLAECLLGHFEAAAGAHLGGLGLGTRRLEAVTALLGLGQALAQLVVLALQHRGATLGGTLPGHQLIEGTTVALQGVLEGRQLAPGHGDGLLGRPQLRPVAPGRLVGLQLGGECGLRRGQSVLFGSQVLGLLCGSRQFLAQPGPFGLEGGDDVGVGGGVEGPGQ